jgi:hypothetical protein
MDEPRGLPSSEELLRRAKEALAGDDAARDGSPPSGKSPPRAPSRSSARSRPQRPAPEAARVERPADPRRALPPPDLPTADARESQDDGEAVDRRARVLRIAGGVGLAAVMVALLGSLLAGLVDSVPEPVLATVPVEVTETVPVVTPAPGGSGGVATTVPAVPTRTTSGAVAIRDAESVARLPDGSCAGAGDFAGLVGGAPVLVRDAAGEVLATAELAPGSRQSLGGVTTGCEFAFTVELPEDRLNYLFEMGDVTVTLSRSQLRAADWQPGIDLGG